MRRAAACLVLVFAAGCGEDERGAPAGPSPGGTRLEVVVRPQGPDGPVERRVVTRVPRGIGPAQFAPVPPDVACTQVYGGPATATVTGTLDDEPIRAEFSRTDGCEIARWDRLEALLGRPAPTPTP